MPILKIGLTPTVDFFDFIPSARLFHNLCIPCMPLVLPVCQPHKNANVYGVSLFCGRMVPEEPDYEVCEHTRQCISCKKPPGMQHYVGAASCVVSPIVSDDSSGATIHRVLGSVCYLAEPSHKQ
ncbi:jg16901 [Pararge aegeria aegeria]|uniref:Jg16901 protein n=1 Tax=Pararge aegeria aegeria TaxID=348720 RepID=A0A8S4SH57_9NEOP|nr:jg16901 [Pararge aegeria aegeria]